MTWRTVQQSYKFLVQGRVFDHIQRSDVPSSQSFLISSLVAWWTRYWSCGLVDKVLVLWPGGQGIGLVAWWTRYWSCGLVDKVLVLWPGGQGIGLVAWWQGIGLVAWWTRYWPCGLVARYSCGLVDKVLALWPGGKVFASREGNRGSTPDVVVDLFLGRVMPVTSKLVLQCLLCQAPGATVPALGLVGQVSVYCDLVR